MFQIDAKHKALLSIGKVTLQNLSYQAIAGIHHQGTLKVSTQVILPIETNLTEI